MKTPGTKKMLSGLAVVALVSLGAGCGLQSAPASSNDALQVDVSTDLIPDTDSSTGDTAAESASEAGTNLDVTGGTAALKASSSSVDSQSTSSSGLTSTLTATELQLLQGVLGGLVPGGTTSSTSGTSSGALSLSDLTHLGLSRRDMALWVLDLVAQQSNLTTEQSFALQLTRALVSRDSNAIAQVLMEQLLPALTSGSASMGSQGTTQ
jgi:hypothetical protein